MTKIAYSAKRLLYYRLFMSGLRIIGPMCVHFASICHAHSTKLGVLDLHLGLFIKIHNEVQAEVECSQICELCSRSLVNKSNFGAIPLPECE